ncbi:lysosomal acid phosphatase-like [Macrosteles quadrilineatus]|uniref:lysosomal acid phosphatase-like n=1 Tax=Macrosteles quadrilineatus TaxID=74068 RepID=UPI0023E1B43D|nr:lysosomal acid phosphatase-like [Macrosteles quadrilineatus]
MMFLFSLFLTFVAQTVLGGKLGDDGGDVIFANVLFRHGDRNIITDYPNDPNKNMSYWPEGLGQLTNLGKRQEFALGQWLRQRYDRLLTDFYDPNLVYVRSTDVDRALMSAKCVLAGIFPPKGQQVWNDQLIWQPIPTHTTPEKLDKILAQKYPCPAYQAEHLRVLNSAEIRNITSRYSYILKNLTDFAGENISTLCDINWIYHDVYIEKLKNMTVPQWVVDLFPVMYEASSFCFALPTWNTKLARLKSGLLVQEMINNMKAKIDGKSSLNVYFYSAHDSTIGSLLNSLGVFDLQDPPYSSTIMMELRNNGGDHYVTLLYRNNTAVEPYQLILPGCSAMCPLDQLINLTLPIIPEDWDKECQIVEYKMYIVLSVLLILPFAFVESRKICHELGDVVFVNVLYRHGARTPDKTYKNDPHKNDFPEGLGELTNEGKRQHYELGQWLRQRYDGLLTDKYSPALIHVLASDKDRVLMSAQCNLAGMYPPKSEQKWNPMLEWQPVPVHTVPQTMDRLIAMKEKCPAYDNELARVLESKEVKDISKKYQYIIDILNKNTGETRDDWKYISNIHDTLRVQNEHNMALPKWSKDIFPEPMGEASVLRFHLPTWNTKLALLLAGPLLEDMVKNVENKVNSNITKVMQVYAGHDTTIINLLNLLGVWDKTMPPYASCIMLELRRNSEGEYYVTLFYRTSANAEPRLLKIPGCDEVCPLKTFVSKTKSLIPQDWDKECKDVK